MAATINIQTGHGTAPGTFANASAVRFKAADNDTADTNNPLTKPAPSGTSYSYEKAIRLFCSVPPANAVNNIRFHRAAGSPSTGVTDYYGERSQASGYVAPVGTLSTIATTAVPTVATAVTLDTGSFSADDVMYGPYLYLQWRLADTVSAGNLATLTYRVTYDET